MAFLTNSQLWDACRSADASFAAVTSAATEQMFSERGFEAMANNNPNVLGDFYALSLKIHLNEVRFAEVKDLFDEQGFGEHYSGDLGQAILQRISQGITRCIDPAWIGLENGDSPDPFVVRKGEPDEKFWQMNESIANLITIPDRFQYKASFTSDYGMDILSSGQAKSIVEGFRLQRYDDKKEGLNAALASTTYPMKDTQKFETADVTDAASAIAFVKLVRDIVDEAVFSPTGAGGKFNAGGFASKIDKSSLKLLARPRLFNQLATISRMNSPEDMSLPIDVVKVEDFGGTTPKLTGGEKYAKGTVKVSNDATPDFAKYKAANAASGEVTINATITNAVETKIYDQYGARVATAYKLTDIASIGSTKYSVIYVPIEAARVEDPWKDVTCLIADKGVIFFNELNPVSIEPIRNPRGRYTNLHLASPDNGICYDHRRTLIMVNKSA